MCYLSLVNVHYESHTEWLVGVVFSPGNLFANAT